MIESPRVMIVGAGGSIGGLKDVAFDDPENDKSVTTHCHAVKLLEKSKHLRLAALMDADNQKLSTVMSKWVVHNGYLSTHEYRNSIQDRADIITIASPTNTHLKIIKELIFEHPKIIILEKPAGNSFEECQRIADLSANTGVPVVVNYGRRFCPEIYHYKEMFDVGQFGKIINCVIRYNRGILRDGVHAIDLVNHLFGEITFAESRGPVINELEGDPSKTVFMTTEKCPAIYMLPSLGSDAAIFEFDIYCEKARIVMADYGQVIYEYQRKPDGVYGKYNMMPSKPSFTTKTSLNRNLVSLYQNVLNHLNRGAELKCTIKDAVNVHRVINMINQQGEKNG